MDRVGTMSVTADILDRLQISPSDTIRVPNTSNGSLSEMSLIAEIENLADGLNDLRSALYEIQEARHSATHASVTTVSTTLDNLVHAFDASLETFSRQIQSTTEKTQDYLLPFDFQTKGPGMDKHWIALKEDLHQIQSDWSDILEDESRLKDELKEDRWLMVFRQSADSAEEMMASLEKAVKSCHLAIETISFETHPAHLELARTTVQSYKDKKKFYHPSVNKALSMLDRGVKDRITTNGESLRRQAAMKTRWTSLLSAMSIMETLLPGLMKRLEQNANFGSDATEVLDDEDSLIRQNRTISPSHIPRPKRFSESVRSTTPGDPFGADPNPPKPMRSPMKKSYTYGPSDITAMQGSPVSNRTVRPRQSLYDPTDRPGASRSTSTLAGPSIAVRSGSYRTTIPRTGSPGSSPDRQGITSHNNGRYGSHIVRLVSPALSGISVNSTMSSRRSLIPVSSPASSRHSKNSQQGVLPPLPSMPSQKDIAAKEQEAKLRYLRSQLQTPEPSLRAVATRMPFYTGRKSTPNSTPAKYAPTDMYSRNATPTTPRNWATGERIVTPGRTAPSAWKDDALARPSSSLSVYSRSGAATPAPLGHVVKRFVPNPLDPLDLELARILESIPNEVGVERLDPPLRKGQRHEGEWKAQYAFSGGRCGRRIYAARLLELNKINGKTRKVMIRSNGVWKDLRFELIDIL